MENKKHVLFTIFIFTSILFLVGCWDAVEIEQRGYLSGTAIDLVDEEGEYRTVRMTNQFVVPSSLGTPSESGGGDKAYRNLSQEGKSVIETSHRIQSQANRIISLDHLEVIILSTKITEKEGLVDEILDAFIRYQHMRRGVLVAVIDDDAGQLLDIETEHEKIPATYIRELLENENIPYNIGQVRVGDIQERMLVDRSFIMPHIQMFSDNSVEYDGLVIFRGNTKQMVGIITGEEARGVNFILGNSQKGSVVTKVEDDMTVFDIMEGGSSSISLTNKEKNNLQFDLEISLDALITEYLGNLDLYKTENIDKFNQALTKKIKQIVEDSIKRLKDDYKVDVLEFDEYLRTRHNSLWREVKDEWDDGENYFSKSDIHVTVDISIVEPGSSLRIKKKQQEVD